MPPEAPAPSTPTSSSATPDTELKTVTFFNRFDTARCTMCKTKVPVGDEMAAELRKKNRPGMGSKWLKLRHHPSCPPPLKLEFDNNGPNSEDISGSNSGGGDGNGGGGFIATDSTPEKKQRTSGIDPAIDPSRLAPLPPTPSPPALKNTGAGAAAAKNGKRKRDYELSSGDSASRNLAETDKVTFELFLTNPDVTPTSTQPASPPEEKPLISPGGGGAAAAKGGERKRDDDVRSGGSASRNLEATEKWTSEVLSTNPDSAPTTEESTSSSDDNSADSSMSSAAMSFSAPSPAESETAETLQSGSSSQLWTVGDYLGREVTVSGVFKTCGQSFDNRIACRVGRKAKKMYVEECGADAGKRLRRRKLIGQAFPEYVYPSPHGRFVFEAFDSIMLSLMP